MRWECSKNFVKLIAHRSLLNAIMYLYNKQYEVIMNPNLALLILSWQVACLFHETETEKLLPGSASATEAESDELDKIHDELTPDVSWDDFNDTYGDFHSAKDRADACIAVLKNESAEFKSKVLEAMLRIANASKEDDNETNVSPEEMSFIQQVKTALVG